MQTVKRPGRQARTKQAVVEPEPEGVEPGDQPDGEESFEIVRLACPDCAQPIAVLAEEDVLPEHALCPTPWNPFGLQACPGTGRPVASARPAGDPFAVQEPDAAVLLTLPQGLDWRMQPFSHAGGPGSRPVRTLAHFPSAAA
ncbi:hypothetical protein ABZ929_18350 [Streptomyces physcomitrii]|uniref:hypothetical protein n=1 Tax=Streptomyces physcomitrii TaxID=2724184 RepID=UPI0033CCDFCA